MNLLRSTNSIYRKLEIALANVQLRCLHKNSSDMEDNMQIDIWSIIAIVIIVVGVIGGIWYENAK